MTIKIEKKIVGYRVNAKGQDTGYEDKSNQTIRALEEKLAIMESALKENGINIDLNKDGIIGLKQGQEPRELTTEEMQEIDNIKTGYEDKSNQTIRALEEKLAIMESALKENGINIDLNKDGIIGLKQGQEPRELTTEEKQQVDNIVRMHERLERPEMLRGTTYKIKPPVSDHAMYITINDIILNPDTEHEKFRPYEIFINSKNLDHYQWIVALTRVLSSVFRKGGDVAFLVEELKAVFDPKGGYFAGEGRFMPSIIAELGYVIERHFKSIGIISAEVLDEHQKQLIEKKRQEFENQDKQTDAFVNQEFPHGSTLCGQCNTVAVVLMDNCETCLNCGYSKCG